MAAKGLRSLILSAPGKALPPANAVDGNAESKVREGVTLDVIGENTTVAPRDGLPEAKGSPACSSSVRPKA